MGMPGCSPDGTIAGYRSGEIFRDDVRTVAVDIFGNRSFYRGIEFDVTEALVKEIELRTPYKVVNPSVADTIIIGTILSVDKRPLSRTTTGAVPQEVQLTITAKYEWKNARTGDVLCHRPRIIGTGEHVPARRVGEPIEVARHTAAAELASEIVSIMQQDW